MVQMTVATELDDASLRRTANDIQRQFDRIGQDVGGDFMSAFASGARTNSAKVEKAFDAARDATGKLRAEQAKLDDLMARGDTPRARLIQQAERAAKARRDEERAIRQAASAYEEYTQQGLRGAISNAGQSGQEMANEFVGGFAGSSALLRLGAAAGPIGLALAGVGLLGVAAGRKLAEGIADGLDSIALRDQFQARLGIDDAAMSQYASAAGRAYASNFGASVEDNLAAATAATRAGLIDPNATDAEIQTVIQKLQGLSATTDATTEQLSRSITTLLRTGLAQNVSDAADIITAGFQSGLDVSGDWLDTIDEYSTQFRKFGLDADEVLTLLKQGFEGGARDTDKVADSLKEFSIRAVDGSKSTQEGFEALGFSAEDMANRFAQGGDAAKIALAAVLDRIREIHDPLQQALIWQRLFGTQFEDMGDAINHLDLDPAKNEFVDLQGTSDRATKTATDNFKSDWEEATRTVGQFFSDLKTDIAEWFSDLPVIRDIPRFITDVFSPNNGYMPDPQNTAPVNDPDATGNMLLPPQFRADAPPPAQPGQPGQPAPSNDAPKRPNDPLLGALWDAQFGNTAPNPGADAPVAGTPKPIDPTPDGGSGGKDKPSFDPSQWSLDSIPLGSFPGEEGVTAGAPVVPGALVGDMPTGPGYYEVDPQKVFDAETSRLNAQTSLQNARYRYLEVMADADATEQDKYNARAALISQGRSLQSAEMRLAEAQQGTWKKMEGAAKEFATGMDSLGAALDDDFGLGEGLSGFVENLIKTVGNLAAAPMLAQLNAISNASPIQGGYGLFGMFGAQNIAAGRSPLGFGTSSYGGGYSPSAMGPAAFGGSMGANSNLAAMMSLAQWSSGKVKYAPASDLVNGLADCSGSISDLVETLRDGRPNPGRLFTTTNFASDAEAAKLGFRPGFMPGALNVGVNPYPGQSGHMAATLPNGVNFEGGGATGGGAQYGGNAAGALDPQFEKHYYLPVGPTPTSPVATASEAAPAAPAAVIPDSVLYSPANTNPGLTAPNAPGPGLGLPGGGGALPFMGAGAPQAAPFASGSVIAGQQPTGAPGAQGGGVSGVTGGLTGAALSAGAAGLDMLAPGAGQAAQTGIQLANRSIGYLAQLGGIAASGVLETLSFGGSNPNADPFKTLPGRVLAGIAGARPAIPNTAGQGQQQAQQQANANDPNQHNPGGPPGPLVNIEAVHQAPNQTPDSVANSVANQFKSAEISQGFRGR
ncbi:tail length tape measure protein [Mycobacterium phage Willsammy]|uniref:Tape measure protein n=1 Tax=Mycobacterium phage Willsammy TaxID=2713268 RepID=A0A6G8R253_9CAUD|nr:tail length tape measure protein [Mycobacterium phage Willsammy]QIN94241.1 tape measure protein [Mycobacterium phage Willsammy]